jgi:hypothetical protein
MRIPDADPDPVTKFLFLIQSSILGDTNLNFKTFYCFKKNWFTLKGQSSDNLVPLFAYMDRPRPE